jgi:hypothetical protein
MSTHRFRLAFLVALGAALLLPVSAAAAEDVSVQVSRSRIETKLGQKFEFRSTITNRGSTAVRGLIAHLNILSLRNGPYVDPEDWSSSRTRYLGAIPAGGSTTITWHMQSVNAGTFGIYVSVLPESGAARPPTSGPTIHLAVASRRTLNSGGILPLALGIPAFLGLVTLGIRFRRGG